MAVANSISTPSKHQKLPVRREPYWFRFAKGKALGFRKLTNGGTWVFKSGRKQIRIGDVLELTYDEALTRTHTSQNIV